MNILSLAFEQQGHIDEDEMEDEEEDGNSNIR